MLVTISKPAIATNGNTTSCCVFKWRTPVSARGPHLFCTFSSNTTAATIWLVASIGTARGAHLYALAALTTFIALIVLLGLARLEKPLQRYGKKHKPQSTDDDPDRQNQRS